MPVYYDVARGQYVGSERVIAELDFLTVLQRLLLGGAEPQAAHAWLLDEAVWAEPDPVPLGLAVLPPWTAPPAHRARQQRRWPRRGTVAHAAPRAPDQAGLSRHAPPRGHAAGSADVRLPALRCGACQRYLPLEDYKGHRFDCTARFPHPPHSRQRPD